MKSKKILLIDDSEPIHQLLEVYSKRTEYELLSARNMEEALNALREEPFDLVLLDIELEETTGFDLLPRIQKTLNQAGLPLPPVVAMSAHSGQDFILELMRAGFTGRLKKPVSRLTFEKALERYLSGS